MTPEQRKNLLLVASGEPWKAGPYFSPTALLAELVLDLDRLLDAIYRTNPPAVDMELLRVDPGFEHLDPSYTGISITKDGERCDPNKFFYAGSLMDEPDGGPCPIPPPEDRIKPGDTVEFMGEKCIVGEPIEPIKSAPTVEDGELTWPFFRLGDQKCKVLPPEIEWPVKKESFFDARRREQREKNAELRAMLDGLVIKPAPPALGGGWSPQQWLRYTASEHRKKDATACASEAERIADWIDEITEQNTVDDEREKADIQEASTRARTSVRDDLQRIISLTQLDLEDPDEIVAAWLDPAQVDRLVDRILDVLIESAKNRGRAARIGWLTSIKWGRE